MLVVAKQRRDGQIHGIPDKENAMKNGMDRCVRGLGTGGLLACLALAVAFHAENAAAASPPKRVKDLGPAPKSLVVYWALSPDGGRLAYKTASGPKASMSCDGKEGPAYDDVGWPFFSSDSKHIAYCAKRREEKKFKDHWCVVFDGKEGTFYDDVQWAIVQAPSPFLFSPDSRRFAYAARRDDGDGKPKWFVVCDGKEGPAYDLIEGGLLNLKPMFSSDSRHFLYWAKRLSKEGTYDWFLVLDGVESGPYVSVQVLQEREEDPGKLRYFVLDGTKASLIEIDWPKK
jgi:hypothetical protein